VYAKEYAIAVGLPENADHAALNVASTVHVRGLQARPAGARKQSGSLGRALITRRSQRHFFLIAFTQYLFDSLHDWHLKILLGAAIIRHLAHILFEGLQINHSVVAFGIIVTAEPGSDKPRLTDFVMHELVTVDFRNIDCHLGLGRSGCCKGKDGY
jgi:hypothetical protein